jgi:hypothetical protein
VPPSWPTAGCFVPNEVDRAGPRAFPSRRRMSGFFHKPSDGERGGGVLVNDPVRKVKRRGAQFHPRTDCTPTADTASIAFRLSSA